MAFLFRQTSHFLRCASKNLKLIQAKPIQFIQIPWNIRKFNVIFIVTLTTFRLICSSSGVSCQPWESTQNFELNPLSIPREIDYSNSINYNWGQELNYSNYS